MILAIDTEATGLDSWHGCRPFMVQGCDGTFNYVWEGWVNPYDRSEVVWDQEELDSLQEMLDEADQLIFHNAKFDMRMMECVGIKIKHLWDKVDDTILAHHCLCSGESHALKYLALKYLDFYNDTEQELAKIIQSLRNSNPDWDKAKEGHQCFPGAGGQGTSWWKQDYWMDMEACRKYGIDDVVMTWHLWDVFQHALTQEDLWHQYHTRRELLEIAYDLEETGYHMHVDEVDGMLVRLHKEKERLRKLMQDECLIEHYFDPDKDAQVKFFLFDVLKLPILERTETGKPSIAKEVIERLIDMHPFVEPLQHFQEYRTVRGQISDCTSYKKWVCPDKRIHCNVWITGTRETRQSTDSPNMQNISKLLRELFGPPPGYVWLDFDLVNIEMRIWTYMVGNKELISIFEAGQSFHLLVFSILYPQLFRKLTEDEIKDRVEYTTTKNGNFSLIYGAGRRKADRTYKKSGAFDLIKQKLPEIIAFNDKAMEEVNRNYAKNYAPYVTTCGGYRLDVPLDKIYKAGNFKVQGSAGWIMTEGMLNLHNNSTLQQAQCRLIQQVHDSAVLELPEYNLTEDVLDQAQYCMEEPGLRYLPTCKASHKTIYAVPF